VKRGKPGRLRCCLFMALREALAGRRSRAEGRLPLGVRVGGRAVARPSADLAAVEASRSGSWGAPEGTTGSLVLRTVFGRAGLSALGFGVAKKAPACLTAASSVRRRSIRACRDNGGVARTYAPRNQKGGVGRRDRINLEACLAEPAAGRRHRPRPAGERDLGRDARDNGKSSSTCSTAHRCAT